MENSGKDISEIFSIVNNDIIQMAKQKQVDTIVNSANPSLMKGEGMDVQVHDAINKDLVDEDFDKMIRRELDGEVLFAPNIIRCHDGQAVCTSGYSLCKNIIHTVGPYYNKTNSCVQQLENCYKSILDIAFSNHGIRKVAIPIISAASKDFDYLKAVEIAVISINNYLVHLKKKHPIELEEIEKIYLVIYQHEDDFTNILSKYNEKIKEEKIYHYRTLIESQLSYYYEIKVNDASKRGYFGVAIGFRYFLVLVRFLYFPSMLIRESARKKGWESDKKCIEKSVFFQVLIPILAISLLNLTENQCLENIAFFIVVYVLVDIMTYLLGLVFLADIQRPSANIIRSILLMVINYVTSVLCVTFFFYKSYPVLGEWAAFDFALLGQISNEAIDISRTLIYLQSGVNFFFMTLVFAFFINHLKQRTFSD